jgi:hypothetical protein
MHSAGLLLGRVMFLVGRTLTSGAVRAEIVSE